VKTPIRIVTADDHPLVLAGVRATLAEQSDFSLVGEAANGDQALQVCREQKPDVLLLDLQMPGMSVDDLLQTLPEELPDMKIVLLTAHDGPEHVQRVKGYRIHGYLLKAEVGEELTHAVRAVYLGAAWFTQKVALQMMQAPASEADPLADLTPRERQVLECIARGLDNQAISEKLHLAEQTVRNYASTVYDKLGVRSRVEAVVWARERGLV